MAITEIKNNNFSIIIRKGTNLVRDSDTLDISHGITHLRTVCGVSGGGGIGREDKDRGG